MATLLRFICFTRQYTSRGPICQRVRYDCASSIELMDKLIRMRRLRHLRQIMVPHSLRAYRRGYLVADMKPLPLGEDRYNRMIIDAGRLKDRNRLDYDYLDELAGHCWAEAERLVMNGHAEAKQTGGAVPPQFKRKGNS